jgi:hypothetical protein
MLLIHVLILVVLATAVSFGLYAVVLGNESWRGEK